MVTKAAETELLEHIAKLASLNEKLSGQLLHQSTQLNELVTKMNNMEAELTQAKKEVFNLKWLLEHPVTPPSAPAPAPEPQVTFTMPMSKAASMLAPSAIMQVGSGSLTAAQMIGSDAAKLLVNPHDSTVLSEVEKNYAKSGQKINAIKEFRARTGSGLKEAKDAVENWMAANNVPGAHGWGNP